ncbi:hypothetical protein [Phormidesmis priestleyi]|nr:hypothetical protein [Phormidesmis priestleyi]
MFLKRDYFEKKRKAFLIINTLYKTMFRAFPFQTDFFNHEIPLLKRKQSAFAIEDLPGLWRLHWQLGQITIFSTFYTRIDQACLLWGIISIIIFLTAQFAPIDWATQAFFWSGLTLLGTGAMIKLSEKWATIEPLNHIISAWIFLMLAGLVLTDLSIFWGWAPILTQLPLLWLALNAFGYLYTGVKMRSRAFLLICFVHLLAIATLSYVGVWQFLETGIVIGLSAVLLAELQWDSSGVCANHPLGEKP